MRAIVADVAARACVDLSRVYATGLSNGGFLSHRLACEASDLVAAIAPVASVIGVPMDECTPGAAVPVMHVHGTSDFLVPYDGNFFYPSVQATVEHWVTTNGCDDTPAVTLDASRTTCETWSGCRDGSEVVLCTIEGGGHEWPPESSGLSTTDAIWDFLSRHTR
jgi:polyhydroxybutyrate depolymerase